MADMNEILCDLPSDGQVIKCGWSEWASSSIGDVRCTLDAKHGVAVTALPEVNAALADWYGTAGRGFARVTLHYRGICQEHTDKLSVIMSDED